MFNPQGLHADKELTRKLPSALCILRVAPPSVIKQIKKVQYTFEVGSQVLNVVESLPLDSLQVKAASVMLQEDTNVDVATWITRILAQRDTAVNTGLQRLSSSSTDSLPTPQEKASCVGNTEDGQLAVATPRPEESVVHLAGPARFGCSQCNKSFLYRSQFIIHQRTHTGERPFRCRSCKKGFLQSSDLRVHQRIHTGEKPYRCSICSKVFTHESSLLGHIRIHTKEMPYLCESCGKRFNHKGNLNVHVGIHSNSRPYKCIECNAAFRQKGTLMRHVKIHSRAVPL